MDETFPLEFLRKLDDTIFGLSESKGGTVVAGAAAAERRRRQTLGDKLQILAELSPQDLYMLEILIDHRLEVVRRAIQDELRPKRKPLPKTSSWSI